MLRFSLIVCTRGRPLLLERLLLGIALLRYPEFELIVICDPEDAATGSCLARHEAGTRIGFCAEANLAKARNIGLAMAQGDIAAFIDDDAVPEPDWLDRLADCYARPEIAAAGGFIRAKNGVGFQSRVVLVDGFGADHHCARRPPALPEGWFVSLTGTNFSVRLSWALALGGFDENYSYFLEETDFLLRLTAAGGGIGIAEMAEVHHGCAESESRAQSGAPKSFRDIARSKAYFCHVNRRPGTSDAAIGKALARFARGRIRRIGFYLLSGRLRLADAARLLGELRAGLREGERLARNGRSLAGVSVPGKFEPCWLERPPRRRLCVLLKTSPGSFPQWRQICELARCDHEVTVIYFGRFLRRRVVFSEGLWLHRLSAVSRLPFLSSRAMKAELERISIRRRFEQIHLASDNPALRKAAAGSGLPRFI